MTALGDLPPELIHRIAYALARPRDVVALSMVTGVDVAPAVRRAAARHGGITLTDFMARGAPLDMVRLIVKANGGALSIDMVAHAARGGRIDVVKYTWIEAADREPVPKRSDPRAPAIKERQRRCLKRALKVACRHGHTAVVVWLLTRLPSPHGVISGDVVEAAMLAAVDVGHLHIVKAIHARHLVTAGACVYRLSIVRRALERDQDVIVAWLHAHQANAMHSSCMLSARYIIAHPTVLAEAISNGRARVARWIISAEQAQRKHTVSFDTLMNAAARGHLATVALAHDHNLHQCTVEALVALVKGDPRCALDALRWAVGEPTVHVDIPVPDNAVRPIAAWGDPAIAYAALGAATNEAFEWLLARADTHRMFTVGAVRWGLLLWQGYARALRVCSRGLVSFDDCDPVAAAVRHFDVGQVVDAIKAGAPCTSSAIEAALLCDTDAMLSLLCQHNGTAGVNKAVRKIAGRSLHHSVINWLRVNVPALCVADLRAASVASDARWSLVPNEPCQCFACHRRL